MLFYCGLNERTWNGVDIDPAGLACISPVYGSSIKTRRANSVFCPAGNQVIQDSGAFCDGPGLRLSFEQAYARQVKHAVKYGYSDMVTHRASYDLLIDEKWDFEGVRTKSRWGETEAEIAVLETVSAAKFLASNERSYGRILSAQGVTPAQYLHCSSLITPLLNDGDIFGLGGWCVIGKMPKSMLPVFRSTISLVIPYIAMQGVKRVHIWGVIYAPALVELQYLCDKHKITVSTDSAGPSRRPAFGQWGYSGWVDRNYKRKDGLERGLDRVRHVRATKDWLQNLKHTSSTNSTSFKQLVLW